MIAKIDGVDKLEQVQQGWLLEATAAHDLRRIVAQFAQQHNLLILTLKLEEKTLEEVFKELTK